MKKYSDFGDDTPAAHEPALSYITRYPDSSGLQIVHDARSGIKVDYFFKLGETMGLTSLDMSKVINVSLRTLQRYDDHFILDADSSSKVLQLKILNVKGLEVFGDQLSFNVWLKLPNPELENSTPFDLLDTSFGYQILHQILGRIEHGIFA